MSAKRLGAVIVAALLIAGAFVVRGALDDDNEGGIATDGSDAPADSAARTEPPTGPVTVVCITELEFVCDALGAPPSGVSVRGEAASATLTALAESDDASTAPVWVTIAPWPEMVDAQRAVTGDEPLGLTTTPVARTPLAIAAPSDGRLDTLLAHCAGDPAWRCAGDLAGAPWTEASGEAAWGDVRPSVGDVASSPLALASFANAVAGYFGDPGFTRSTWESDPSFAAWGRRLARTVPAQSLSGGTPLGTMTVRPSALDLPATTDAELAELGGATDGRFGVHYPEPAMVVDAVIAAPDGVELDADLLAAAEAALIEAGWDAPGATPAAGPSGSTMLALLELWGQLT